MSGVMAFLVWLFSLWTWFRESIIVGWVKMCPKEGRVNSRVGVEQLRSNEGQHESSLTTFLSSLPENTHLCYEGGDDGPQLVVGTDDTPRYFLVDEATHNEFLATISSSKIENCCKFSLRYGRQALDLELIEEIVGALVSNIHFTKVLLHFRRHTVLQIAECVSKLLLKNKAIEDLSVQLWDCHEKVGGKVTKLLANGLRGNQTLKNLQYWMIEGCVGDEGMKELIKPLKSNESVLQYLSLYIMSDGGMEQLGVMLLTNTSLKTLKCFDRKGEVLMRGFTSFNKALCVNKSLENLECKVENSIELKILLEPLMTTTIKRQANTTLKTLHLRQSMIGGKEGIDILTNMICTNTTLLELDLMRMDELDDDNLDAVENVVAIMEALKTNESMKKLSLLSCQGVGGYKVLGAMMDMLLENHQLEEIALTYTPLMYSGDAKHVLNELEKRKKKKVGELIKGMANVSPKSGRVFLCGNPRAGKTTLRMSVKELPEYQNQRAPRYSITKHLKKKLEERIGTSKVQKGLDTKSEIERTRGIEVDHVECDGIGISIWDMAGQSDYHSFHDLVIPNLSADGSCSLFLLTCNPMHEGPLEKRNIFDIRDEIQYWLRFIASNTRRSLQYRPHVSIVMTHEDQWRTQLDFRRRIEDVVAELKSQFTEVLEFDPNKKIFTVNGRDRSCAREVFDFMKRHLKQLLERLPKTIKACSEVQSRVVEWNHKISKQLYGGQTTVLPMLKWEDFSDKFCKGIEELHDGDKDFCQRKQEFVAISLNDGGHIMYHEEGEFVITNPHWFCHDIMGEFLHRCAHLDSTLEMISSHGIISNEHVKRILMDISRDQWHEGLLDATLSMMKKLHMCYEQDDKSIMIPSTLQDKEEGLSWLSMPQVEKLVYVGRRLSCKDAKRTMLSLGFFPRLQVSFFQVFQKNNVRNSFKLFKDVIMFIFDSIEVIIEFNDVDVDIMLRSDVCQDKVLEILECVIVRHIQGILMNPTLGCPGVILVEHILRPECIEKLVGMKERKDQYVAMEELELEVVTRGFGATHNWKGSRHLERGFDAVKDLLGNKAWATLLKKQYNAMERYRGEILRISSKKFQRDALIGEKEMDSTWGSMVLQTLRKPIKFVGNLFLEEVFQKLDNNSQKLDNNAQKLDVVIGKVEDICQRQKKFSKMQVNLLGEVSRRIEDLIGFSINLHRSQDFPKIPYLLEVGSKKLLTCIVPGLKEFDLHLMCESRYGIHEVVGQVGCKVNLGTKKTKTILTMVNCGLKLLTISIKIGAHVVGGMGEMVPDLSAGVRYAGLFLDTPNLIDQMSSLCSNSLPIIEGGSSTITKEDKLEVEKWLIEVLEPKCKEKSAFYDMFKLRKVVYRGDGSEKGSIAWLCDDCEKKGLEKRLLYNAM